MSEIKVNKISPKQTCTQLTLGDSGDTIIIPAGATIQNSGTATGFGRTGTVNWDTTPKTTSPITAVSGNGYFINTTSGAITVNLPATPAAGDIVAIADYNGTAATNSITVGRNSSNINGSAADFIISKNYAAISFVYVDATAGWRSVDTSNVADVQNPFIVATGGTITCDGDFKIHTFTGPGTFTVTNAGSPGGSTTVDYLVVAGGAGASGSPCNSIGTGGGGAGGYRTNYPSPATAGFPVTAQAYPITVGAGGGGGVGSASPLTPGAGNNGNNSIFSTITSTGGGRSGTASCGALGQTGGSGGGGPGGDVGPRAGGAGNTPPTSPPQGNPGGNGAGPGAYSAGGGGGAGAPGGNATKPGGNPPFGQGGNGGNGSANSISGSPVTYAGGGGGGSDDAPGGTGGTGGGGNGGFDGNNGSSGTVNTGGGGGGTWYQGNRTGGSGGSGIVIIRYKFK